MTELHHPEGQRSGYAIRAPEFSDLVALAESFGPNEGISQAEIERGILFGLNDLTDKEQKFLLLATSLLSHKDIQKGNAFCYLGSYTLRRALGGSKGPIEKRTLSRIKRSLEEKGLILRHYDRRHSPLEKQGIDLRPLLARIDEIQERTEEFFQETRDYFEEQQSIDRYDYTRSSKDLVGGHKSHPNRLNLTKVNKTVQTSNELTSTKPITLDKSNQLSADHNAESLQTKPNNSEIKNSANCSPKGASEFWKGYEKSGKQRHLKAISELKNSLVLSPQLLSYISLSAVDQADENVILEGCYRYIAENFSTKRNTDKTFYWAVKKYGWKAVQLLICAIEDIAVQSPEGWLGYMTTRHKKRSPDLRNNFQRIKKEFDASAKEPDVLQSEVKKTEKPVVIEKTELNKLPTERDPNHELWADVKTYVLKEELMNEAEIRSWLEPCRITGRMVDEVYISAQSRFQQDYLEQNFGRILQTAFEYLLGQCVEVVIDTKPRRLRH